MSAMVECWGIERKRRICDTTRTNTPLQNINTYKSILLLRTKIMCFIYNIISNLHFQCWREQFSVAYCCGCIPDLDNMEVTFGRESHTNNCVIFVLEHPVGEAMNHTIDKHLVGLGCIYLLGPRTSFIILGSVPERTISFAHQKEHT